MKTYGFEYYFNGSRWLIHVPAASAGEARERLQRAGDHGTCIGTLEATIPAVPGGGWLTRLLCWWRNR